MNEYALVCRTEAGTATVAKVTAGTQGQAMRKLYRANRIDPSKAAELGFTVEFQKPTKENHAEQPIHRFPASSKMGRKIAAASAAIPEPVEVSQEVQEWNAQVEAKKAKKLTARVNASHKISIDPNAWAFENGLESF